MSNPPSRAEQKANHLKLARLYAVEADRTMRSLSILLEQTAYVTPEVRRLAQEAHCQIEGARDRLEDIRDLEKVIDLGQ
jgi:hypothetical protein